MDTALHPNPDFESGTTPLSGDGWKKYDNSSNSVFSYDTSTFHYGTRSLKIVSTSGDNRFSGANEQTGAVAGQRVTISGWAKASAIGNLIVRFVTAPSSGGADYFGTGATFQESPPIQIGTVWQKYEWTFTIPAGHTKWRFYLDPQNGRTWNIDETGSKIATDLITKWTAFTPTILAPGGTPGGSFGSTATRTGKFRYVGESLELDIRIILGGSGINMNSNLMIGWPPGAAPNPDTSLKHDMTINYVDSGSNYYVNEAALITGGVSGGIQLYVTGNNGYLNVVSSTSPFTWAAPDEIQIYGSVPHP